jgi:hypothetical protein
MEYTEKNTIQSHVHVVQELFVGINWVALRGVHTDTKHKTTIEKTHHTICCEAYLAQFLHVQSFLCNVAIFFLLAHLLAADTAGPQALHCLKASQRNKITI